jgi:hypothetical protein
VGRVRLKHKSAETQAPHTMPQQYQAETTLKATKKREKNKKPR